MVEMNIQEYLDILKTIQNDIINFLDNEDNIEENFQLLRDIFEEKNIFNDKHKLTLILHLLVILSNNHFRTINFFSKIERILLLFKEVFQNNFLNSEICKIFIKSKRLLLFLIEEKMIKVDKYTDDNIFRCDNDDNYTKYFTPEIKPFLTKQNQEKYENVANSREKRELILNEIPEDFNENRKIGENHHLKRLIQMIYIKLIRKLNVISYYKK